MGKKISKEMKAFSMARQELASDVIQIFMDHIAGQGFSCLLKVVTCRHI